MDFIGTLASAVGVDEAQAKALAGGLMGQLQGALPEDQSAALADAVPEMGDWQAAAAAMLGGAPAAAPEAPAGGMFGALAGAASAAASGGFGEALGGLTSGAGGGIAGAVAGALGGEDAQHTVALVGMMQSFGIPADKAAAIGPIAYEFLESRLPEGLLDKVLDAAPFLMGGKPKPAAGGIGGMLGGLLG